MNAGTRRCRRPARSPAPRRRRLVQPDGVICGITPLGPSPDTLDEDAVPEPGDARVACEAEAGADGRPRERTSSFTRPAMTRRPEIPGRAVISFDGMIRPSGGCRPKRARPSMKPRGGDA